MSIVRLTPLSLLVLLLALAVVPAIADETKQKVGDVTFVCKTTGSDNIGFDIIATNDGKTDMTCTASCTLNKKGGGQKTGKDTRLVRGDTPAKQSFYGEGGVT